MITVEEIRNDRERREARAAERAAQLEPGDYYASGNCVWVYPTRHSLSHQIICCESHWDAVLVLLALSK